jgi:hypothetical protein
MDGLHYLIHAGQFCSTRSEHQGVLAVVEKVLSDLKGEGRRRAYVLSSENAIDSEEFAGYQALAVEIQEKVMELTRERVVLVSGSGSTASSQVPTPEHSGVVGNSSSLKNDEDGADPAKTGSPGKSGSAPSSPPATDVSSLRHSHMARGISSALGWKAEAVDMTSPAYAGGGNATSKGCTIS